METISVLEHLSSGDIEPEAVKRALNAIYGCNLSSHKKYHYIGVTPYMPYDNNCMVRLMPSGMAGVIAYNKNELTPFNASTNDVVQYCGRLFTFTEHKHWAPFTPSPDVDFDGPMIKADKTIMVSTAPTFDTPFDQMIREKTKILMDQLGIPSSIERHGDGIIASYDIEYIGETVTDIVSGPKKRYIDIQTQNVMKPYVKIHFAEIGNVVTYKGTEYIYTGVDKGWIVYNEHTKDNKEEKNMVMDIRFIGKTSTAIVDGSTNSTVSILGELKVAKAGNIVMYNDMLFMFIDYPKRGWNRISDKLSGNEVRYDKIPRNWMSIKKVVFNNPATIVFWNDGTKTIVKCGENDVFDTEKGLAMAITKKALGNQGNYFNQVKKWLPEQEHSIDMTDKLLAAQELICDLTFNGATKAELVRAIRFSKDLIDASKGADIDITESIAKNGIAELEEKYQPK